MFLGNQYSLSVFRNAKGIKTYINDSHLFINLVEDKFGRLFYHSWFEEMNFGGGPDYLEESFSFAKDEEEADRMYKGKVTMYSRLGFIPLVCWSEEDFVLHLFGLWVVVAQRGVAVLEVALVGNEQSGSRGVEILHGIAVVPLHAGG